MGFVNVALTGSLSGADVQFRPGSSGAQHGHKRTSTILAQRVGAWDKFRFTKI